MGQKIHPTGFRLAVNRDWTSKWFANSKHFPTILNEDIKVRAYLKKKLAHASVGKITIERPAKNARITIHSARPGVVIGKKGEDIETLARQPAQDDGRPKSASTSRRSASPRSMRSLSPTRSRSSSRSGSCSAAR